MIEEATLADIVFAILTGAYIVISTTLINEKAHLKRAWDETTAETNYSGPTAIVASGRLYNKTISHS